VVKSEKVRWAVYVAHARKMENAYKVLIGNYELKKALGIHRRRWEHVLKWILKK
jgi:hypothetical protein